MVSFVAGLEGVIHVTVDMCALRTAEVTQHLHRKTTTLMTSDPVVADAFRPYRCKPDHEHAPFAEGPRSTSPQFCEVMVTAIKASRQHRDRSAPVQPMTLVVTENDEPADDGRDADSGLDEDDAPADDLQPTESQIKMVDQYHRNLGHSSRRGVFEGVEGCSRKTCRARVRPTRMSMSGL